MKYNIHHNIFYKLSIILFTAKFFHVSLIGIQQNNKQVIPATEYRLQSLIEHGRYPSLPTHNEQIWTPVYDFEGRLYISKLYLATIPSERRAISPAGINWNRLFSNLSELTPPSQGGGDNSFLHAGRGGGQFQKWGEGD